MKCWVLSTLSLSGGAQYRPNACVKKSDSSVTMGGSRLLLNVYIYPQLKLGL